tara:strand:- start:863 stop:1270 length:408 start_codon:yes stop_codon:yes gene_type:complete
MEKEQTFKDPRELLLKVSELAHSYLALEICGFVGFDKKNNNFILQMEQNEADEPSQYFMINPLNYLLFKAKYEMVAIFHSHIVGNEEPSEFDIKMAEISCQPFLIYSLNTKKTHIFTPQKTESDVKILNRIKALI